MSIIFAPTHYALKFGTTAVNMVCPGKKRGDQNCQLDGWDKVVRCVLPWLRYTQKAAEYSVLNDWCTGTKEFISFVGLGEKYREFLPNHSFSTMDQTHKISHLSGTMNSVLTGFVIAKKLQLFDLGLKWANVASKIGNQRIYGFVTRFSIGQVKNSFLLVNLVVIARDIWIGTQGFTLNQWLKYAGDRIGHGIGLTEGNQARPESISFISLGDYAVLIGKIVLISCATAAITLPYMSLAGVVVGTTDLVLFFIKEYNWTVDPANGFFNNTTA